MTDYPKISAEELAQLQAFAAQEGRKWKQVLMYDYWYRGLPVRGFPLLYGLRNSHGPSWLDGLRLPKQEA
jgi:hypothetical protein